MPGKRLLPIFLLVQSFAVYAQTIYWSDPSPVVPDAQFNQSAYSAELAVVMWQEFEAEGPDTGRVYLSLRRSSDGLTWENVSRCIGPYPYKGKHYRSYSVAVDTESRVFVAAATGERTVTIFASTDRGGSFSEYATLTADHTVVVPEISIDARRGLALFVSYLLENEQGIYFSRSPDGREWTPFSPFVEASEGLIQPSLPFHLAAKGRDYVVFQARTSRPTEFQLFCKTSSNGGAAWSSAVPITDKMDTLDETKVQPLTVSNQRPFLTLYDNELYLAWERNQTGRFPQIFVTQLNDSGGVRRAGAEERVSAGATTTCANPQVFEYQRRLYLVWFENASSGLDHVMFTAWEKPGASRIIKDVSRTVPGGSLYPQAVVLKGFVSLFWQTQTAGSSRLFYLGPDRFVKPPALTALDFVPDGYGRLSRLSAQWELPEDSSGIRETRYLLSSRSTADPASARIKEIVPDRRYYQESIPVPGEGTWYILVFAVDLAGNISSPARVAYTRDVSPPGPVRFTGPARDEGGFLDANTFTVTWEPPAGDVVGGYATALKQISADVQSLSVSYNDYPLPGITPTQTAPASAFTNLRNGVYAFSVSAFDKAGNQGPAETIVFRLRHWKAETYISTVIGKTDAMGVMTLKILGGGFAEGGQVDTVIIDRDGVRPYDYEFKSAEKAFTVESDRVIAGLSLKDVDEGVYQVGVRHPVRGYRFSGIETVRIDSSGVVKYGAFGAAGGGLPGGMTRYLVSLSFTDIMLWLLVATLIAAFVFSSRKVAMLAREAVHLRSDVGALIAGGELIMPETKKKISVLRKRGLGLRVKFTLLISLLALLIVVIVAVTISIYMIRTQQSTLAGNLYKEVNIVLSGIVRGSRDTMLLDKSRFRVRDNLEKQYSLLPEEARYAAVTGPRFLNPQSGQLDLTDSGAPELNNLEYVWAAIGGDVNTYIKGDPGTILGTLFSDDVSAHMGELAKSVNELARERASDIGAELDRAQTEYERYQLRTDAEGSAMRDRIGARIEDLQTQLDAELDKISSLPQSVPAFDPEKLDLSVSTYVFYKPIVARLSGYDNYFWGLGRLSVSMDNINRLITRSRDELVIQTSIIALIVLALGVTSAFILASIIITPLRRLSQGVAVIRDTQDKTLLKDHRISVRTHDEIRELADTVNQMTQGLVRAAVANKELVVGKEVQKMFIPLETDAEGKKRSTGALVNDQVDIFGYYEGAKGVSGDYFDFKQLDDRHFAIIKCDVAGKGVSASLIMVEVATIFLNYFRDWSYKRDGLKIDKLVYRINDMIEERGFKGRFAALNLCLFNARTGVGTFCNAGDNQLYVYRSGGMQMETLTLPSSPAAGVFPSDLVMTQSGFTQEAVKLEKGDTLFLFTDGIEEAKRTFRDGEYRPIVCAEPGLKEGESHGGTHNRGMGSEELGLQRFKDISGALFSRGSYRLEKFHNPIADEELTFDFSTCQGTTEEAVLAVISVEKIFRIYTDARATENDLVRIDRKIDDFLSRCFLQYRQYFKQRVENPDESDYSFYAGLKEDEQYDDLTILALRKK